MQLVYWNCRGLGNPIKANAVKDLMRMVPSEILLLQETKVEEESLLLLRRSKWKLNSGKAVISRGTCGGLATLWCEENFQLIFFLPPNTGYFQSYFISPVIPLFPSLIFMCLLIIMKNKIVGGRYQNSLSPILQSILY